MGETIEPWEHYYLTMKEIGQQFEKRIPYVDIADIAVSCPKEWEKIKEAEAGLDMPGLAPGGIKMYSDRLRMYWFYIFDKIEKQTTKYMGKGMEKPAPRPFRFKIFRTPGADETKSTKWIPCDGITVEEWGQFMRGELKTGEVISAIRSRGFEPKGTVLIEDDGLPFEGVKPTQAEPEPDIDFAAMIDAPEEKLPVQPVAQPVSEGDVSRDIFDISVEYQN